MVTSIGMNGGGKDAVVARAGLATSKEAPARPVCNTPRLVRVEGAEEESPRRRLCRDRGALPLFRGDVACNRLERQMRRSTRSRRRCMGRGVG